MSLGFSDTSFLFFLALLLFGPKKLPEIGRQIGKFMNEFKRASNEFRSQIEAEIATLERESPTTTPQILPPAQAPQGAIASGTLVDAPDPAPATVVDAAIVEGPLANEGAVNGNGAASASGPIETSSSEPASESESASIAKAPHV